MVVGCLVWYQENPNWLSAAITAVAPALDHLVAVDGAYALYPGALNRPCSPPEQVEAVTESAYAAKLPLTLYQQHEPFYGNEVEKRQLSIDLAKVITTDEDWLLVFDGDNLAEHVAADFKQQVANVPRECLAGEYAVCTPHDSGLCATRGMYRALRTLEYGPAHYTLSAEVDGELIWVWGNPTVHQPCAEAFDFQPYLRFEHRSKQRDRDRYEAARSYYRLRDDLGVERVVRNWTQGLNGEMVQAR